MLDIINILKVLSDENRLRIAFMLETKTMCVCEILELLNITGATLSSHLKILKYAGIIECKKNGRWIEYFLSKDKKIIKILDFLESIMLDKKEIISDRKKIEKLRSDLCT